MQLHSLASRQMMTSMMTIGKRKLWRKKRSSFRTKRVSTSSTTLLINIRWSTRNNTKTETSTVTLMIKGVVKITEEAVEEEAVVMVVKTLKLRWRIKTPWVKRNLRMKLAVSKLKSQMKRNYQHCSSSYISLFSRNLQLELSKTNSLSFQKYNFIKCTTPLIDLMLTALLNSILQSTLVLNQQSGSRLLMQWWVVAAMNGPVRMYLLQCQQSSCSNCISTWTGPTKSFTRCSLLRTKMISMRICLLILKKMMPISRLRQDFKTSRKFQKKTKVMTSQQSQSA